MKILFSFESSRMPLRSITLINWLISRGHIVHVLYDNIISHEHMEADHYFKNIKVFNTLNDNVPKSSSVPHDEIISNINDYDIWFADVLNYKNYHLKSEYNSYIRKFKNLFSVVSYDDGSDFFNHRIDDDLHDRVNCWMNNLIEKDKSIYHPLIREKCMLLPTYIEASNENYDEFVNILKERIKPFDEKVSFFYFSGAITGCMPMIDCRFNSILHLTRSGVPYNVRVTGTDPAPFLKYFYDCFLDENLKKPQVDRVSFLNEINNHKFILSPKGNCQPLRRQYESFAFNNLVFINENNVVDYLFEGIPNVHFVQYKLDCSDLKEKLNYYYNNLDEAKKIADAGTKFWEENCRIYPDGSLSESVSGYLIDNFKRITGISL